MKKTIFSFIISIIMAVSLISVINPKVDALELYTETHYYLTNWSGKAITVSGYDNGANVTLSTLTGGDDQIFEFEIAPEGGILIRNVHSGRYLEVRNGEQYDCAVVGLWQNNGQSCARWQVSVNNNDTITFVNCCSGLNMNVAGNSSDEGAQIWQYHADGTSAEQFTAVPVGEATGNGQTYTVNTQMGLYLRTGPGQDYDIICGMPYGSVVTAYKSNEGGWFYVNYNGNYGWAKASYLTATGRSSGNSNSGQSSDYNNGSHMNLVRLLAYRDAYWSDYNPDYSSYRGRGGDCANYVSQLLSYASSAFEYDDTWKPDSYAFINCDGLWDYLKNDMDCDTIYYPDVSEIAPGDVIWTSSGHVVMCVKVEDGKVYCTGHTTDNYESQKTYFYRVAKTSEL
ncbi:RICIN domain-containing protein [Ruminococcus sp.]|uniref:RICIN domain-containing protein n=1 Tax=Ruminococcus sp. TaxID=41978 RepID=UPI0025868817|nr:RICIN domain-containing protein [Ruminococcus sp.]MCR5021098.1 RICIN domain-containing protein [Ruminococcus sp.]